MCVWVFTHAGVCTCACTHLASCHLYLATQVQLIETPKKILQDSLENPLASQAPSSDRPDDPAIWLSIGSPIFICVAYGNLQTPNEYEHVFQKRLGLFRLLVLYVVLVPCRGRGLFENSRFF